MSNSAYSEAQPGVKLADLKPEYAPKAFASGAKSTVAIDPLDKNEPKIPPDTDAKTGGRPRQDNVASSN
jgi:hypothetical protein